MFFSIRLNAFFKDLRIFQIIVCIKYPIKTNQITKIKNKD